MDFFQPRYGTPLLGDALAYPSGSNLHVLPWRADFCLQGSTVASHPRGRETSGTNWSILLTPGQETELCKFTWQALRRPTSGEHYVCNRDVKPWGRCTDLPLGFKLRVISGSFHFAFFSPFSFQQFETKMKMLKLEFKHPGVSNMRRHEALSSATKRWMKTAKIKTAS